MKIYDLQKQAAIFEIMFYLEEHKEATVTELITKAKLVQSSVYSSLKKLSKLSLIKMKEVPYSRGTSKLYYLSDKGKKVIKHLHKIEETL